MSRVKYRPGQICPRSGQWAVVRCHDDHRTGHEATVVQGEPFPPTAKPGHCYVLADPTQ
ncbi:MAG: hypothetical protein AB7S38_36895 [Vulcanimicrobiota bacterium]